MNKTQIREMMRDIDPQFQQKADERAAAAQQKTRRSAAPVLIGSLAAGCAAIAAVAVLPKLKPETVTPPSTTLESEIEPEITEIPAEAVMPITDFSADTIRLMAPAYAPYILDISAEQQKTLAEALLASAWVPCDTDAPQPDGEAYSVFVYNGGDSYRLTAYADHTVVLERDGEETRWQISEDADRAIAEAANPASVEGHLTWCAADSVNAADIWKNTRVGAKECDMTDKRDVFFKMNNTPDYFDRCSGNIRVGGGLYMTCYEFQVDLNMGQGYEHEENYRGSSMEALLNGETVQDIHFTATTYLDGENHYSLSDLSPGQCLKYTGVTHRIDSPTVPFEDLHSNDPENTDYDYWNSRRQLLHGISVNCIENYRMAVGYLQDFSKWEIVGTDQINGRLCVQIEGSVDYEYDITKRFVLFVDEETGVTVRLLGYNADGVLNGFIDVTDLAFDDDAAPVKSLDPETLASASEPEPVMPANGFDPTEEEPVMDPEGAEVPVQEQAPAADMPAAAPVTDPAET